VFTIFRSCLTVVLNLNRRIENMGSRFFYRFCFAELLGVALAILLGLPAVDAQQDNDTATAAYADAANFQTGGAVELAIEAWNQFLTDHPQHSLAALARHYLGVCYMQRDQPDYVAAATSFASALDNRDYELREESMANLGWCLYASGTTSTDAEKSESDPTGINAERLNRAIATFGQLREEFPSSRFLDRSLFYSGEAAFALGAAQRAIEFYDQLLSLPTIAESPLRCDGLYARGITHESLQQYDQALASYQQLIDQCADHNLIPAVQLRMGEVQIQRKEFDAAAAVLEAAFQAAASEADKEYALFRQAYALVRSDQPAAAASKYEQLLTEFPTSEYRGQALLASAQSTYRSGDIDLAAERFERLLTGDDLAAATEAAHWLARIEISKANFAKAAAIVKKQIERGVAGAFAVELRLDLAELLALDSQTAEQAIDLFLQVYRDAPQSVQAPRALYNAAFTALQADQRQQAQELATEFLQAFPQDALNLEVQFIAAEALLLDQQFDAAADRYQQLVRATPPSHDQRPRWLLRGAVALNAAGRFRETVDFMTAEIDSLATPADRAEAFQQIGRAQLLMGDQAAAIDSFQSALDASPAWPGNTATKLLLGQTQQATGNESQAVATWNDLIESDPQSLAANQARYRIAQIESDQENYERSIERYQQIVDSSEGGPIVPHARYGKAWALMQQQQYRQAIDELDRVIQTDTDPSLRHEALLARGISQRNLGEFAAAQVDLQDFLASSPSGTNLGHALYELALIDQKNGVPQLAAEKLQRLVAEVPDYPSMDKVLYELGWSLQESDEPQAAVIHFDSLVNRYPDSPLVADAAYFVGQNLYAAEQWEQAARRFRIAATRSDDGMSERSWYRLGWSLFKLGKYSEAEAAFAELAQRHPEGTLSFDAVAMVAQCRFKRGDYEQALAGYSQARELIRAADDTASSVRDEAARNVRELSLLHGGQSAAQLKLWEQAIEWHEEHRRRFPSSNYLAQVFYETGFAYHQLADSENAIKFYSQVADKYRNEIGARARFMIGEIRFGNRELAKAIPEFQRVMFGYGAEQAPEEIKNWQAKSGFEAGRASEALRQAAKTEQSQQKAMGFARDFYTYVIEKHANHPLAAEARQRLEALSP
jgi:tetratricopeptide (TPR) repeat protein